MSENFPELPPDLRVHYELMTELDRPDKLVTVLYGAPGQAKTVTAVRLALGRTLLINVDGSWDALLQERWRSLLENLILVRLESFAQLGQIDFEGFDTVIIDPFSEVVSNFIDTLLEHTDLAKRPKITSKNPLLKGLTGPGMDDYQLTRNFFRRIVGVLISDAVPASTLIFTSHASNPIKGLQADDKSRPQMPNETFQLIARRAQIISYIEGAGTKFNVHTNPMSFKALGKSRFEEIKPTMDVEAYIKAHKSIPRGEQ